MSDQIDDGGSAFPVAYHPEGNSADQPGMSLRDWLAGQEKLVHAEDFSWEVCEALAGPRPTEDWKNNPLGWLRWSASWQAAIRYIRADAMLAARKGGAK